MAWCHFWASEELGMLREGAGKAIRKTAMEMVHLLRRTPRALLKHAGGPDSYGAKQF